MSFLSVSVPLPSTRGSDSSGTDSSSNLSPSAMGLLNQTVGAKPKSTKKKKFKELYKVDVDTIGHGGVHRMILRRRTVLPVPRPLRPIIKQDKAAAPSTPTAQKKGCSKNVQLEICSTLKKDSARLPKTPKAENVLKPKPASNSLFPPVQVPRTSGERRKLLSQLTKERNDEMTRVMEMCALEMKD